MKSITLKKLDITNFKGVHRLTIDFNPVTYISGDNATFKTTIFDAFTWMLFGKDSADREGFQIKRLDLDGNPIQKTECEVLGELDVNGKEVTIKRIFKEIWTKKRGSEEAVFSGNEQLFYY
ncbi:MAG TPA: ATP-binding protein, partial [Flavitalea sp.]|nr:ATP-binding protein [Flavitalea sp.]